MSSRRALALGALMSLAAAGSPAPAGAQAAPARDAQHPYSVGRSQLPVLPPRDPAAYQLVLERLRHLPAQELFAFASYQGMVPRENLGEEVKLSGAMVRMGSMQLGVPLQQLLADYTQQLRAAGIQVREGEVTALSRYLAFRDPADGFLRTITVLPVPDGTMVMASVSDPARMSRGETSEPPKDWPVPPLASQPVSVQSASGDRQQRTWLLTADCQSPTELIEFYRQALPPVGWKADPQSRRAEGGLNEEGWTRGAERCVVSVSKREGGCAVSVMCLSRRNP